nr:hypothetical protein [candidate division Zixibacteria bacterium]
MRKSCICLILMVLMLGAGANAFDGNRKGFVLGGGLGFGPVAKVTHDDYEVLNKSGLAMDFLIGYAWDEQNMIVFLRDGVIYNEKSIWDTDITLAQGFSGVGYFHYFGPVGKSFYIVGGLGFQDWTSLESNVDSNDVGAGLLIGCGYEFVRHVQVHGSLSFGKSSDPLFDYNHTQLQIGVSAVAF